MAKSHGKTVKQKKCVVAKVQFCYSFFVQTTLSNDNLKTVQALTLILTQNGCSSQRATSQPLSVFIASILLWSIKAIHNTLWLLFIAKDAIFYCCTYAHMSRSQAKYHYHLSGNERNRELTTRTACTVSSRSSGQGL